jgi:hypothetical protein
MTVDRRPLTGHPLSSSKIPIDDYDSGGAAWSIVHGPWSDWRRSPVIRHPSFAGHEHG